MPGYVPLPAAGCDCVEAGREVPEGGFVSVGGPSAGTRMSPSWSGGGGFSTRIKPSLSAVAGAGGAGAGS